MEPVNVIEQNDKSTEEGAPTAVQVVSGKLQDATVTQVDEKHDHRDILAILESDEKSWNRARAKPTFWVPRWCDAILRRKPRAPPEPTTGREEPPQPKAAVTPISSKPQPLTARDSFGPRLHPRERGSGEVRQKSPKVTSIGVTNGAGPKNLAELYARYDRVQEKRKDPYDKYEDIYERIPDWAVLTGTSARENRYIARKCVEMVKCYHCRVYFTPKQNVRDLDNSSSPCSYHPAKILPILNTRKLHASQTITMLQAKLDRRVPMPGSLPRHAVVVKSPWQISFLIRRELQGARMANTETSRNLNAVIVNKSSRKR